MKNWIRWAAPVALALALVATACGGGSDDEVSTDTGATDSSASAADAGDGASTGDSGDTGDDSASDSGADDADADAGSDDAAGEEPDAGGTYEPGSTEYRAVNLLDVPVDLYVRTTGLVEAFPIQQGLAPGEVSEFVAPPEGGSFVVTDAGAGDPTCVSGCDHFITQLSAFPEEGPVRTVLLYDDEFSGPTGYELWEQPSADRIGSTTNAIVQGQSSGAVAIVVGAAVREADFGLRLSSVSTPGCLEPFNLENILIGGNQTPSYLLDGDFTIHDNQDRECETPVDGPFPFAGQPGSRTFVFLSGVPGSLEALQLELLPGGEIVESAAAGGADRDTVVALMTEEVSVNLPAVGDQAGCLAELIVDNIGTDILYIDGALVDLDSLPDDVNELAGLAMVDSVEVCGIDPAAFG